MSLAAALAGTSAFTSGNRSSIYGHGNIYDSSDAKTNAGPFGGVEQAWVTRYNNITENGDDLAFDIAVDGLGNVYVTGQSISKRGYDYATIKYNSAGQQQWVADYDGPGNADDIASALAIDSSGNVYVTGQTAISSGNNDYATIKYNSAGQQQWVARYNGPGNGEDHASAIAVDDSGNVYVTGGSLGAEGTLDYATIKYDSGGQQLWVARYNGPVSGDDNAVAIAVDGSGHVYVTGQSAGSGTGLDYATIQYNSSGQQHGLPITTGRQMVSIKLMPSPLMGQAMFM
jgi:hypothetical protein